MEQRLRVLHLSTELPHRYGASGGAVRQFHLLRAVAQLGHEVTVIAPVFAFQHRELDPVNSLAAEGIRLVPTRRRSPREREAVEAFLRRPGLLLRATHIPFYGLQMEMLALDMRDAIEAELARDVDVVNIEHDTSVFLAGLVPPNIPKVLTLENVAGHYYELRASEQSGLSRLMSLREARACARYITPRMDGFDAHIACSEPDAELTRKLTSRPIEVVPNGTDALKTTPTAEPDGPPSLLFTGTMNHPPNAEGILWFHQAVWPLIVGRHPETKLVIVGRHPQPDVMALAQSDARIEVTGAVPDMAPYYAGSTVTIAPLRSGSGTRLKVLDALAAGRPMVTTSIGCEGIEVTHDEDVLIADAPEDFADAVSLLIDSPADRARLAAAGRELVVEKYDWSSLGAHFADLLVRVVAARAAGAAL